MTDKPLGRLAKEINEIATHHGFWEKPRNFGEMVALMHSELSEALEEHREGRDRWYAIKITKDLEGIQGTHDPMVMAAFGRLTNRAYGDPNEQPEVAAQRKADHDTLLKEGLMKPEGWQVELVDCLIRILDTLHASGADIDEVVAEKMAYNRTRPYKHGKEY